MSRPKVIEKPHHTGKPYVTRYSDADGRQRERGFSAREDAEEFALKLSYERGERRKRVDGSVSKDDVRAAFLMIEQVLDDLSHEKGKVSRLEAELESLRERLRSADPQGAALYDYGLVGREGYYVYKLLREGVVVYVGQSKNLMCRMPGHSDKEWDQVAYRRIASEDQMRREEGDLIHAMHPRYNQQCPKCGNFQVRREQQEAARAQVLAQQEAARTQVLAQRAAVTSNK